MGSDTISLLGDLLGVGLRVAPLLGAVALLGALLTSANSSSKSAIVSLAALASSLACPLIEILLIFLQQ